LVLEQGNKNNTGAAIVCKHVALDGYPALFASRDEPVSAEDSRLAISLCNSGENENEDDARIWAISTMLRHDPTLVGVALLPAGTTVVRSSERAGWKSI
jgi:hypothetical protein